MQGRRRTDNGNSLASHCQAGSNSVCNRQSLAATCLQNSGEKTDAARQSRIGGQHGLGVGARKVDGAVIAAGHGVGGIQSDDREAERTASRGGGRDIEIEARGEGRDGNRSANAAQTAHRAVRRD